MTERLYYNDPFSRECEATVLRVEPGGERSTIWLDRSVFYPTTGGQPFDTGRLDGLTVVDVAEDESGDVMHVVAGGQLPAVGATVRATIDWNRRLDHIQQHSGQHVLSAALVRLCTAKTVSFHLGSAISTIDLERAVTPQELAAAEDAANQVVWEDRPVSISYRDAESAAGLPLRKPSSRGGTLRLIDIEDWDLSACGGTHVARTGTIGLIGVLSWERFKGGQRIEFVCGGRALTAMRGLRDAGSAVSRLLSVTVPEIPAAVERLQQETRDARKSRSALLEELAGYQSARHAAAAEAIGGSRVVMQVIDGDAGQLKSLATAITATPGYAAVLVSQGSPAAVVVSRSADVGLSSQALVGALVAAHGGRGGGRPDLAQAGGLHGAPAAILATARTQLVTLLA